MVYYFNPVEKKSLISFRDTLKELIRKHGKNYEELVLICIGSDRATGDCLGPMVGHRLSHMSRRHITIYGTLEKPVHAKNLSEITEQVSFLHPNAFVIAIDASLGITEHVGLITLGEGSLFPGIGVNKDLPQVGDLFITGIVNIAGLGGQMLLQTTRLHVVLKLADFIATGIYDCLRSSKSSSSLKCAEKSNFINVL